MTSYQWRSRRTASATAGGPDEVAHAQAGQPEDLRERAQDGDVRVRPHERRAVLVALRLDVLRVRLVEHHQHRRRHATPPAPPPPRRGASPPVGLFGLQTSTSRVRPRTRAAMASEVDHAVGADRHLDRGRAHARHVLAVGDERRRRQHGLVARREHGRGQVADQRVGAVADRDVLGPDVVPPADRLQQDAAALGVAVGARHRRLRGLQRARRRAGTGTRWRPAWRRAAARAAARAARRCVGLVRREERVAQVRERCRGHARPARRS